MVSTIEQAESSVRGIFTDEYPHLNFNQWNEEVSHEVAQNIIKNVGKASRINVKKFIEDLTNQLINPATTFSQRSCRTLKKDRYGKPRIHHD